MTPDLLVIGTSIDSHVGEVLRLLPKDLLVERLDVDRFPVEHRLEVELSAHDSQATLDGHSITEPGLCWFRRLGQPGVHPALDDGTAKWVRGETEQALTGMLSVIRPRTWVNEYWACRRASAKLLQLKEAALVGLATPKTLVTNDHRGVDLFIAGTGPIIYKTLHAPVIDYGEHSTIVFTTGITSLTPQIVAAIPVAPCQFQPRLEKSFELRITSIFGRNIAIRIDSQETIDGALDWRAGAHEAKYSRFDLPDEIDRKLSLLLESLGIEYGASDFVVTQDGEFIFLEVNPHGAWLWMENRLGESPITQAIADAIISRVDLEPQLNHGATAVPSADTIIGSAFSETSNGL